MNTYDPNGYPTREVSTAFAWTYTLIVFALGIGAGYLLRGWLA
jgi:hypothetical protein